MLQGIQVQVVQVDLAVVVFASFGFQHGAGSCYEFHLVNSHYAKHTRIIHSASFSSAITHHASFFVSVASF